MTITAQPRIVLRHNGNIQGVQGFSFGVTMTTPNDTATQSDLATWLSAVNAPFNVWCGATQGFNNTSSSDTKITNLTAYYYHQGATRPAFSTVQQVTTTPASARTLPPQCAVVLSLLSNFAGRFNRGRVYIPIGQSSLLTGGTLSAAVPPALATSFAAYMTSINTMTLGSGPTTVVAGGGAAGANPAPATKVQVDNVVDTQRRRRDKIAVTTLGVHAI